MSSCYENTSGGGFTSNQDSSEPSTSNQQQHKSRKIKPISKSKAIKSEPTEYTSRLRPRPTRQTEHYRTTFPSKRSAVKRSSSEFGIASTSLVTAPFKKLSADDTPSTSTAGRRENPISKNNQVKEKPGNRSAGKEKASAKTGKRKAADQIASSSGLKSKKKLASQTEPERKTASEESSKIIVKPSTSTESASSSKATTNYNSNAKGGAKPKLTKVTGRFPVPRKTKSAETKSRLFSKHITGSGRLKSLSKGEAAPSSSASSYSELKGAKSTTGKTGSCASSRRGSERGKRSAAVSGSADRPATDDGCGGTSNNQAMRMSRSRNSRDATSSQRNSTETRTENNEAGNASTVRTSLTGPLAAGANAGASSNDSEPEDSDITRLQALLEARGLPPHFFGNLGPRMQQILHRSMGSGSNSKAQQYLQGMQAVGDESRQLQAAIGMCQLLVMGNEDTLVGFPVKNTVPALITLLKMEHNFDLMNHACRALTYMMEALPRSSAVVVDAIPVFLEKLQVIQCMDVAEQSLTALNMLSRRHAPAILTAGGLSSCLLYIDFFSLPAQRSALSVAANCCLAIGTISTDSSTPEDEFNKLVKSSLPLLSSRLTHHDKKCVESACMCFVRLVDNYQQSPKILATIAENDLFSNIQQLLVVTPPLLSSSTFVMIIRTMTTMCSNVRMLAIKLVKDNIADTLKYLLCGTVTDPDGNQVELVPRSPQELYEITSLIGELLPKLPLDNQLFSINHLLWQSDGIDMNGKAGQFDRVAWQWKDESNQWRPYIRHDSMIIEAAHASTEQEVSITTMERSYTIDFESMQQINDDTGTSRAIQRVKSSDKKANKKSEPQASLDTGAHLEVGESSPKLSQFIKILFKILYEVYSSSAGSPAVRHRCLRAIQRMVYYTQPMLLSDVLKDLTVSSHISSMLSSPDIKVVVGALQLAEMLMQKLPDIFADMFHREGVLHQVKKLTEPTHPLVGTDKTSKSSPLSSTASSRRSTPGLELESPTVKSFSSATNRMDGPSSLASMSRRVSPPLTKAKAFAAALTPKESDTPPTGAKKKTSTRSTRASRSSTSSFLSNLNPTKWGRSLSSVLSNDSSTSSNTEASETMSQQSNSESKSMKAKRSSLALPSLLKLNPTSKEASDMEKVKEWIRNRAGKFLEEYFNKNSANNNKQTSVLEQMTVIAKSLFSTSVNESVCSLKELCSIVSSIDVSSFELQHSGLINSLLQYLTSPDYDFPSKAESDNQFDTHSDKSPGSDTSQTSSKDFDSNEKGKSPVHARIRYFLHVFAGLPVSPLVGVSESISSLAANKITPMQDLVRKLNQCVAQLEQLPVKTHDLTSGGAQALRVFSTRQLKCQLQRHPDCHHVKQWLGGPVKVDPLVQVQAIERYLVARGYGVKSSSGNKSEQNRQFEFAMLHDQDEDSEDEIQEEDEDELSLDENTSDCMSSEAESHTSNTGGGRASSSSVAFGDQSERRQRKTSAGSSHKLDFYIGNHKLPHHITVYQAVRQYSSCNSVMTSEDDLDLSTSISDNSGVWNKTHVIRYKLINNEEDNNTTNKCGKSRLSKKLKSSGKQSRAVPKSQKMNESLWTDGVAPVIISPLDKFLVSELPSSFTTVDACSEVLCLLRVVHAISRYWYYLYSQNIIYTDRSLVPQTEFTNIKINAKCTRQLQDPLIIITGQLPNWLQEIATVCPFLLSFETRQLLFKITAFDRDRAMQHLLDIGAAQELSTAMANASNSGDNRGHSSGRFMPRIEKKKCSVSRENLLLQAEKIIFDYGHSKSMIEVDYEGEVGTGLGPTLEFFTLVSKEFQKSVLNLWREELTPGQQPPTQDGDISPVDDIGKNLDITANDSTSKSKDDDVIVIEDEITSSSSKNIKQLIADEGIDERDREFVISPTGLFPKPLGRSAKLGQVTRIKNKFRFLGKFMAKALLDGRMVDLPFSLACFKWLLNQENSFTGMDLAYVDPGLALTFNKLKQVVHQCEILKEGEDVDLESVTMDGCPIEDLGLDMQLPGYPFVELMKGGKNITVTIHNLDKYLNLITHWSLYEGTKRQFEAMKEGFQSVFPSTSLNYFYPEEMDQLFCGSRYQPWNGQDLAEAFHPDHGYTQDSPTVKTLYRVLSTYDLPQQRSFLQFVTGCPHLPVGGFMSLNPRLTIVRKTCDDAENVDDYLPSVMTCLNYLKLPEYSSEAIMRAKLQLAAAEGQKSFLLS